MLTFQQLSKAYADGTRALDSVSISIPRGQFCVILGPSGAGKSTLLRVVNGLVEPTDGTVSLDGQVIERKTLPVLRRKVAMIHQHFNLTQRLTVAVNVLSGGLPAISTGRALVQWFPAPMRAKACELVRSVGLTPAHLSRRVSALSGGQQQRVGIARAFMLDPEVVLADEPVASLDPKISRDILALIHAAARERNAAVLCSLHQVDLAREFADRIIGMRAGAVVFDGAPDELTDERLYALYHGELESSHQSVPPPGHIRVREPVLSAA